MKLKARAVTLLVSFFLLIIIYNLRSYVRRKNSGDFEIITANSQKNALPKISDRVKPQNLQNNSNDWPSAEQQRYYLHSELERLQVDLRQAASNFKDWPWLIAASWVNERQIYPEQHPELATILFAMSSAKIISADVLPKGTQLKLLFVLEGHQKVVFKQKRYNRDYVVKGKPYDGYDRHNGEIAAFHLDRIFNFRRAPITVGRTVNLREEVLPVATERLKKTFLEQDNNLCYYGVCYYCRESEKACAEQDVMEGAVTLWFPEEYSNFEKLRHPYQRTYVNGKSAKWENDETYCEAKVKHSPPYDKGPRLLDITDASVFDYLIGNADRHHYEVFKGKGRDVMLLLMDNAKSFGNPHWHEQSILAPLRQCCILRNSTWIKLHYLQNRILTELLESIMETDPIAPVLDSSHLKAVNERLPHLISTVEQCIKLHGKENVLLEEWHGLKKGR